MFGFNAQRKANIRQLLTRFLDDVRWHKKVAVIVLVGLALCWTINRNTNDTAADQQLALVKQLWLNISTQYISEFEQRPFTRLPDLIISGRKKCGTKTLLAFLLQHPRIHGNREEYVWHETMGSFRDDMKAFMGHFSHKNLTFEPNQAFVAKMTKGSAIHIAENQDQLADFAVNETYIKHWYEKVIVIECLCDPIRRLYSDFLHVRDKHRSKKPNSLLLGPQSDVYPFQNMTFDNMVDQYLPLYNQMKPYDKVRLLFKQGLYSHVIETGKEHFGHRLIVVDGETFKTEPWTALGRIERRLSIDNDTVAFFTRKRFVKREDGFYVRK